MATRKVANLARMTTATTGTGTITLGSVVSGWRTFAEAGISNADEVFYGIVDGANREFGWGVYTSSGTTLTRNVISSTNSNNAISLSGSAQVFSAAGARADGSLDTAGIDAWVQFVTTTGSSTITIPKGATKCRVTLQGGGGGSSSTAGGGGGTLIKWLSGLTPGNTFSLSVATASSSGQNGENTTLSSGTQSITTLTAGGGSNAGDGGDCTNGDLNIKGGPGLYVSGQFAMGGDSLFGYGGKSTGGAVGGVNYGGGGAGSGSSTGAQGCAIFEWYP